MRRSRQLFGQAAGFLLLLLLAFPAAAQRKTQPAGSASIIDSALYNNLKYRHIGPFRGGRSAAVAGIPGKARSFLMGATGGGVWRTDDAGNSWQNISDGFFGGSVGAIQVSPSEPNTIYVGGGEVTVRGNVSHGYGMWKSYDGGKSWKEAGLKNSRRIPRIQIHPKNPEIVYAAVLGHLHADNSDRGVYKSTDGGQNWRKVLFVDNKTGAVDISIDPHNPRTLYAAMWQMKRTPYSLESGGPGSGLWKSTDGGETWENISKNKGLPKGIWGNIGVSVSPVRHDLVWAIIENEEGGVYKSTDGGKTWEKTNDDRDLRQRAWYYTRIYADTQNEDIVYVMNVNFFKSKDGGKSFKDYDTPHGDHHDLWIDPTDNQRLIVADDGGGQVSYDAGDSWSTYENQPTAQFYRLATDNAFPYRIYAAQQDNSTVRIPHRTYESGISESDWEETAGGESGHIAPDPNNPDIVYGGSYGGFLTRHNHKTKKTRLIDVWPDNPMGYGAGALKYRFQWNFPIFFSPHEPKTLYCAAQHLFKTTDEGQTWEVISPDLTRNDSTKLGPSGGPITKDNTSVEYYCTIFAALESPHEKGVLWTGSDDGLIHLSRDGGKNWSNVTPPTSLLPAWSMINSLEPHPSEKGGLYVAATGYKNDDFRPYLLKTSDYGKTWTKIVKGIDNEHFTRVIRADPDRPGLLYAGTESGMYVSFDEGQNWQPFQLNLPIVPITDLAVKNQDLIVATQGRSLWILDNLTTLHQLKSEDRDKNFVLFKARDAWRIAARTGGKTVGQNPESGIVLDFFLKNASDTSEVRLDIMEENGDLIRSFRSKFDKKSAEKDPRIAELKVKKGFNRFAWDMRYPEVKRPKGMILWFGGTQGALALPGNYKIRLKVGENSEEISAKLLKDPNSESSDADLKAQFDFMKETGEKLAHVHRVLGEIEGVKKQIEGLKKRFEDKAHKTLIEEAGKLDKSLTVVQEALYQTKNRSSQDPLNYPIKLNNRLSALRTAVSSGDFRPTASALEVKKMLYELIDKELAKYDKIREGDLKAFEESVKKADLPVFDWEK